MNAEKPEILFHASSKRDLTEIKPRKISVRDPQEGPVVFASPDKGAVTKFLMSHIKPYEAGRSNGVEWFAAIEEQFMEADVGGAVYHVPVDTFSFDSGRSQGNEEWTSKVSVVPTKKDVYENSLEAMIDHGVQVYLLDELTFKALQDSPVKADILEAVNSVNQLQGKNVKEIKFT